MVFRGLHAAFGAHDEFRDGARARIKQYRKGQHNESERKRSRLRCQSVASVHDSSKCSDYHLITGYLALTGEIKHAKSAAPNDLEDDELPRLCPRKRLSRALVITSVSQFIIIETEHNARDLCPNAVCLSGKRRENPLSVLKAEIRRIMLQPVRRSERSPKDRQESYSGGI